MTQWQRRRPAEMRPWIEPQQRKKIEKRWEGRTSKEEGGPIKTESQMKNKLKLIEGSHPLWLSDKQIRKLKMWSLPPGLCDLSSFGERYNYREGCSQSPVSWSESGPDH